MNYNDKQYSIFNGKKIRLEIFGASHATEIGVKLSGFSGLSFDAEKLQAFCDRRKAKNTAYSTKRLESDVMSGLSMPIPKAIVATIMSTSSIKNLS